MGFKGISSPKNVSTSDKRSKKDKENSSSLLKIMNISGRGLLRRVKIRQRIAASFLIVILIPLFIIGTTSYLKSSSAVHDKISTYSVQLLEQVNMNIEKSLANYKSISDQICFSKDNQKLLESYKTLSDLDKFTSARKFSDASLVMQTADPNISTISLLTAVGDYIGDQGTFSDDDKKQIEDIAEKANGKITLCLAKTVSSGYSLVSARCVISFSTGQPVGYLFIVLKQNILADILGSLELGKNANVFIVDSAGKVISSNHKGLIGQQYSDNSLTNKLMVNEDKINNTKNYNSRILNLFVNKTKSLVAYEPIDNTDWYLVSTIPYTYLNQESYGLLYIILGVGTACFVLALLFVYFISKSISAPLKVLTEMMNEAKEGNLTKVIEDKSTDEIGIVITAFNGMVGKTNSLISIVKGLSQNVADNSNKITTVSEQSHEASEQIAATMQQIASGSSYQAAEAQACVENMNTLSDRINTVAGDMNNVSLVLKNNDKAREEAIESIKYLNDRALETDSASTQIINNINDLNDNMKEIKNIVGMIVSISEQTNLLSLNAAIEAARAGESGRGFAVVAEEIRKLATQSRAASAQINSILSSIQEKANTTTNEANKTTDVVKAQMEAVKRTDTSLNNIFESMDEVVEKLNSMSSSINEIVKSKENTLNSIEGISSVSEENAATTQEVSANTEQQIAGTQLLRAYAKELDEMVHKLNSAISVFKVS